jgi:hypothetical protein
MTELDIIRAAATPRPATLWRKLAWRVRSALGFVVYGLLILPWSFPAGVVGMLIMLYPGAALFDEAPLPQIWLVPTFAVSLACFSLPIIGFVRWVKRLRGEAVALVRDGYLVDVKVTEARRMRARGGPLTSARIELPGGAEAALSVSGHPESLSEGALLPGLVLDGASACLVFLDGRATPAKLR